MADEPEDPALVALRRIEAKIDVLAQELHRMRDTIAHVELRLTRLESECAARASNRRGLPEPALLDIPGLAPPLATGEDEDAVIELVRRIWERRTCVHVLSDEEREALEEAWRQGVLSREEVAAFVNRRRTG